VPTVIGHHDVKDTRHWLASPKRQELADTLVLLVETGK
jgi:hypothetical protein